MKAMIKKIKSRVMHASRESKLDHFYSLYSGGKVLDVGVSGSTTMSAGNLFLNTFRAADEMYVGLGIMDLSEQKKKYPGRSFVQYAGGRFPFADNEFEWVFSNAVVEHVGLDDDQLGFVNEMIRVSRYVFFTTPNKYFPVEAHTNLPFLHWNNRLFYNWCRKNRPWTTKENLYLFSYRRLKALMDKSIAGEYKIYRNQPAFWPMTFTVVCARDGSAGDQ
ncbi:hypothetical protein TspCOW1_21130 [Thiohalobacter sp. COW1]|uniref:class I SAM-dependent methyltransferase n=1 Tax=Thiohalobacter sp. COW1 TaxID=2795687 RepID=UPI001938D29E|nr:class I SAM-dependent methyltransferase [Thiohalobacter sp. COW1]BCO32010.1 hypothetical protein TspCOW1_21130 [Thiohalobacter sp. COW1]